MANKQDYKIFLLAQPVVFRADGLTVYELNSYNAGLFGMKLPWEIEQKEVKVELYDPTRAYGNRWYNVSYLTNRLNTVVCNAEKACIYGREFFVRKGFSYVGVFDNDLWVAPKQYEFARNEQVFTPIPPNQPAPRGVWQPLPVAPKPNLDAYRRKYTIQVAGREPIKALDGDYEVDVPADASRIIINLR